MIERSFQGLSIAIETVRIVEELMEIWPNEVCDRKLSWCECKEKTEEKAVRPREAKVQQSGTRARDPESTAKEGGSQREVRRTFKMLREVWLNIGIEKINTHESVVVKALLDSGTTEMFIDKRTAAKHGFRLQKLERPIMVRNVNGMNNSRGAITH